MSEYNFKKEAKLYLVADPLGTPLQYNIDISAVNFSQTVSEKSFSNKTLHSGGFFEGSKIVKANPANFEITFPALREDDFSVVVDRLLDCAAFDLYVTTQKDGFKIRNAVITNGNIIIERLRPLSLNISGQASEVSFEGAVGSISIPGAVQARSGTRTYNRINHLYVDFGTSVVVDSGINNVAISITNNIKWNENQTVPLCNPANQTLTYPENFTITSRNFSGSVTQYLTDTNVSELFSYSEDSPMNLSVGQEVSSTVYGFDINMNNCAYTNTINSGSIFTQVYNWRMVENPANLSDIVSYITV